MGKTETIYICPVCFRTCADRVECHEHRMLECHPGQAGSELRKPLTDRFGNIVSRAPRWYLEAQGAIPAWTPLPEH